MDALAIYYFYPEEPKVWILGELGGKTSKGRKHWSAEDSEVVGAGHLR